MQVKFRNLVWSPTGKPVVPFILPIFPSSVADYCGGRAPSATTRLSALFLRRHRAVA